MISSCTCIYLYTHLVYILVYLCMSSYTHITWSLWVAKKTGKKNSATKIIYKCRKINRCTIGRTVFNPKWIEWQHRLVGQMAVAASDRSILWELRFDKSHLQIRKRNGDQSQNVPSKYTWNLYQNLFVYFRRTKLAVVICSSLLVYIWNYARSRQFFQVTIDP